MKKTSPEDQAEQKKYEQEQKKESIERQLDRVTKIALEAMTQLSNKAKTLSK